MSTDRKDLSPKQGGSGTTSRNKHEDEKPTQFREASESWKGSFPQIILQGRLDPSIKPRPKALSVVETRSENCHRCLLIKLDQFDELLDEDEPCTCNFNVQPGVAVVENCEATSPLSHRLADEVDELECFLSELIPLTDLPSLDKVTENQCDLKTKERPSQETSLKDKINELIERNEEHMTLWTGNFSPEAGYTSSTLKKEEGHFVETKTSHQHEAVSRTRKVHQTFSFGMHPCSDLPTIETSESEGTLIYAPPGSGKTYFQKYCQMPSMMVDTDFMTQINITRIKEILKQGVNVITNRIEFVAPIAEDCKVIFYLQEHKNLTMKRMMTKISDVPQELLCQWTQDIYNLRAQLISHPPPRARLLFISGKYLMIGMMKVFPCLYEFVVSYIKDYLETKGPRRYRSIKTYSLIQRRILCRRRSSRRKPR